MDLEALLSADPDVVIDIGEPKGTIAENLTALTDQLYQELVANALP